MKLFWSPGACSLAIHISLREAGLDFSLEKVDIRTGVTASGRPVKEINAKGYVPFLHLDDGSILTEGVMLQQWISDRVPERELLPRSGTPEYYRALEWLLYISTELHKGFGPLFNPSTTEEARKAAADAILAKFAYTDAQLAGKEWLLGTRYSSADAYLFTVFNWSHYVKLDVSQLKNLLAHNERMRTRPAVRAAWEAEGLKG
jgi:glutathione S-transferase